MTDRRATRIITIAVRILSGQLIAYVAALQATISRRLELGYTSNQQARRLKKYIIPRTRR